MHKSIALAVSVVSLFAPLPAALAEVQIQIQLGLPALLPPLVEVEPGMRVVQGFDEEIFFIGGYYWVSRDGRWYRARDHRRTWYLVRPGRLPPMLARHEPGRYRQWRPEQHPGPIERREVHREVRREAVREVRREVQRQPPREVRPDRGRPPAEGRPPPRPQQGREQRDGKGDARDGDRRERGR
jgi:hypothetical protein